MKICVIGYSGAGKSTLAQILGNKFNLPVLQWTRLIGTAIGKFKAGTEIFRTRL